MPGIKTLAGKSSTALALLIALNPRLLAAEPKADDNRKVFVADELTTVAIHTERGKIEIKGTDRLTVQAEKTNALDPNICVIVMEPDLPKKTLKLEVKKRTVFSSQGCLTGFRVELPKRMTVRAAAGTGDISAESLDGDLSAETGTGDIRLKDLHGAVKAHTGTGEISGIITAERGASLDTGTGAIKLKGLTGAVDVNTGTGEVTLEWAKAPKPGAKFKASVNTGSSNAAAIFPEGTKLKAELKSGAGSSTNEIGDSPDAGLVISMQSGAGNMSVLKAGDKKKP
ncbi:MAG: DUF4097 family beta strand repeat protein [Elusimicrobia bacterium]|nr:DUF4097 family beta strand repeat protein [Elusimicrobiota bacterium]